MRHAVLGPGGVGGLLSAALARAGHPVLLLRRPGSAALPPTLTLKSASLGTFQVSVRSSDALSEAADVVWIAVKATQLDAALGSLSPAQLGAARVVPLLNGLDHLAALRARYGARVLAGVISVEAFRSGPGLYEQRSPFARMGLSPEGGARGFGEALAAELRGAGLECALWEDENRMLWAKLTMLAPMALATAAAGRPMGEVRADPDWDRRLRACARECCAVASACGAPSDAQAILAQLAAIPAQMKGSMLRDREADRPLELDAIGGAVLRRARAAGVPAPETERLVAQLSAAAEAR
jgi:2-dehydropantoate 2-reductase